MTPIFDSLTVRRSDCRKSNTPGHCLLPVEHVLALVAFSGAMKGTIALSFPEATTANMVNRMLVGEDAKVNEDLFDAVGIMALNSAPVVCAGTP